jgi:hypothetical protein
MEHLVGDYFRVKVDVLSSKPCQNLLSNPESRIQKSALKEVFDDEIRVLVLMSREGRAKGTAEQAH